MSVPVFLMIEKRDGMDIPKKLSNRQPGYGAAQAAVHNQGGTAQAELFSRYPGRWEIERELSRTAAKAAKAVLTGSNARLELERLKESNQALQSELAALFKVRRCIGGLFGNYACLSVRMKGMWTEKCAPA